MLVLYVPCPSHVCYCLSVLLAFHGWTRGELFYIQVVLHCIFFKHFCSKMHYSRCYPGHTSCYADGNAARCIFGLGTGLQPLLYSCCILSVLLARFLTFKREEQESGIAEQPFLILKAA